MIRADRAGYAQLSGCGLNILTDDELAEMHRATLDVLEDAGLLILNDEAQEIYYSSGCKVDEKNSIVKIPSYLVEEAIKSAPPKVLLAARNPKNDYVMGGKRVGFATFGVAIKILDLETGKVRESTSKDMAKVSILCDALENLDVFASALTSTDVPAQVQGLVSAEIAFNNCTKHYLSAEILSKEDTKRLFNMGVAIAGSEEKMRKRPLCSIAICPISPLQFNSEVCEVIIESARLGLPCDVHSEPLTGAATPVTLAGALVIHNAENLGGIVLSQLTNKGAPVIYGSTTQTFDLRKVNALVGDPETSLLQAAAARFAQYYNLPSYVSGT